MRMPHEDAVVRLANHSVLMSAEPPHLDFSRL